MSRSPLMLAAGFVVWTAAFVALYAMLSVGCRFGWHEIPFAGTSVQRAQLIALFLVHVAAGIAVVAMLRGRATDDGETAAFIRVAGYGAALAALGSTLFSFFGVFFLTACY